MIRSSQNSTGGLQEYCTK